jgi:hypothetical protein
MGKTYRHGKRGYDEDDRGSRRGKHHGHSNGRKSGGMRVINGPLDDEDDYFDDDVQINDQIYINKYSEDD